MYHLKRSFGGSGGAADCSSSSAILKTLSGAAELLHSSQLVQHAVDADPENPVGDKKEQPKEEDSDDHDTGRHFHFLARGRDHFAHLCANVAQKPGEFGPLSLGII